jgi:hydrogenase maturation protease
MIAVVAYGNPLRSDDGVAWRIAERLESAGDPVVALTLQQLTPELALVLSQATGVIFVDAAAGPVAGEVSCADVHPAGPVASFTHHLRPASVLALARGLYGATPRAALVTVVGERFDLGEGLSPVVKRAVPRALRVIRRLVRAWSLASLSEAATLSPQRIPHA